MNPWMIWEEKAPYFLETPIYTDEYHVVNLLDIYHVPLRIYMFFLEG